MHTPAPKPTKKERKADVAASDQLLRAYRKANYHLAEIRDGGLCAICYFNHGRKCKASAHHHIYGRDQYSGGWREHYTNIMCVCDTCHPLPIQFPGASKDLSWVEEVALKMNSTPINKEFKHNFTGGVYE